jgi:hypothetical protein
MLNESGGHRTSRDARPDRRLAFWLGPPSASGRQALVPHGPRAAPLARSLPH